MILFLTYPNPMHRSVAGGQVTFLGNNSATVSVPNINLRGYERGPIRFMQMKLSNLAGYNITAFPDKTNTSTGWGVAFEYCVFTQGNQVTLGSRLLPNTAIAIRHSSLLGSTNFKLYGALDILNSSLQQMALSFESVKSLFFPFSFLVKHLFSCKSS